MSNLPPGCGRLPGEDVDDSPYTLISEGEVESVEGEKRCQECSVLLTGKPALVEQWRDDETGEFHDVYRCRDRRECINRFDEAMLGSILDYNGWDAKDGEA